MIYFQCDYTEGAHPLIMQKLMETNLEQSPGYGYDVYCESARAKIRTACRCENADVYFISGGTQTNLIAIASMLRPYESVISAVEGHISCHEVGAIEATGHEVTAIVSEDGKINAQQVRELCYDFETSPDHDFMVKPGMVYISYPTESGTLYTKQELLDLRAVCTEYDIPLYIDGARLGYGLMSPKADITLPELANLCDMFYIGGTKCGAYIGEALVINNDRYKYCYRNLIKQRGGVLAKGRLMGIQFDTLFTDNLYFDICKSAVDQALRIRKAFEDVGVPIWGTSYTNQQFPILTSEQLKKFEGKFAYEFWCKLDEERTVVRFCTCWATKDENVDKLIEVIKTL